LVVSAAGLRHSRGPWTDFFDGVPHRADI
jgi:hypothetical protein